MKRTIAWLVVLCILAAILAVVVFAVPATPGKGSIPTPAMSTSRAAVVLVPSLELPVPAPSSIGVPSGVATAIPSEPAQPTVGTPKATPAPTPIGRIVSPVVVAKGWATYQAGTGLWGSPSDEVRSWGVGTVTVCGPLACRRIQLRNGCACGMRRGLPTLIDLAEPAWVVLCGSPSAGICRVAVSR